MDRREAWTEKMKAQLRETEAKIDVLRARAEKAGADARLEIDNRLQDLRSRRDDIRTQLDELARTGGDAWEDLRAGTEKAWEEFRSALDDALGRFRGS